jgi:UPF0271 protein
VERVVFDTAGFFGGLQNSFEKVYTTPLVIEEVRDSSSLGSLSFSMITNKVIIMEPSQMALRKVDQVLRELNERSLSKTDKSVIALAVDLSPAVVFTDDFAIQNALIRLGIRFQPVRLGRKAEEVRSYSYVCKGCGKVFKEPVKSCDVCGGEVKKSVAKVFQREG